MVISRVIEGESEKFNTYYCMETDDYYEIKLIT